MKARASFNQSGTIAEIPVPGSKIRTVVNCLRMNGVPEYTPARSHGWQYAENGIVIAGEPEAVSQAVEKVLYVLNGPRFETGLEVAARHKQGALPCQR